MKRLLNSSIKRVLMIRLIYYTIEQLPSLLIKGKEGEEEKEEAPTLLHLIFATANKILLSPI